MTEVRLARKRSEILLDWNFWLKITYFGTNGLSLYLSLWWSAVWLDVWTQSCPKFLKSCPNVATAVFAQKVRFFKAAQKVTTNFGYFCKKIYLKELSKFAQYGHTGLVGHLVRQPSHRLPDSSNIFSSKVMKCFFVKYFYWLLCITIHQYVK